jgi:cell division septal protein FtsQ
MRKAVSEDPQSFLQKNPSRRWIGAIAGIVLIIIFLGLGSAFLPDQFTVQNIVVSNTRPEVAQAIKDYAQDVIQKNTRLFGKTSIFLVPRDLLEFELPNRFSIIKTVQVLRELPNTLHIVIQEKVPVAIFVSNGINYALDPNGVAFEEVSAERMKDNKYPIISDERKTAEIEIGKAVVNAKVISMMHDIERLLPEQFALNVDNITIPAVGSQELHVHTNEGWVLVLDSARDLSAQFSVLEKILMEQITSAKRPMLSYIDLRAPGKAFFKFKDGT